MVSESLALVVAEQAWRDVVEAPAFAFLEEWAGKPSLPSSSDGVDEPPQGQTPAIASNDEPRKPSLCDICNSAIDADQLAECSRASCVRVFHVCCLQPLQPRQWFCAACAPAQASEQESQVATAPLAEASEASEMERSSPVEQMRPEPMKARQHASGSCRTEGYYQKQKQAKSGALEQSGTAESKREDRLQRRQFQRATTSAGGSSVLQANQLQIRNKKLKLERSGIHDWGVRTEEPISEGDFIVEYIGEYVRSNVAEIREKRYQQCGIGSSYLFRVSDDWVIDATKAGNLARYLNHSCSPNCKTKVVIVDKQKRVVIYAKRSISAGEELTYDYKFPLEPDNKIPCLCGSRRCRGSLN